MSDTSETEPTGEEAPDPGALRERGDKEKARADGAEQQVADLQRQLAFSDAGIPADGAGAWFRKAYDGELTTEAITASFTEGGGAGTAPAPEQAAAPPEGADVVQSIQAGMAQPPPVAEASESQQLITEMQEAPTQAALMALLDRKGLLADEERSTEEFLGALPEHLRP